jgi:hypothetical protein
LRDQILAAGLPAERVDPAVAHCRRHGMTAADAEPLFRPACVAHAEQLSADFVFLKIEEGLAKQVDAARVAAVAENRLRYLRQAETLVPDGRQGHGSGGARHLIAYTCMALESGLPPEVLQAVFSRPGGMRYGRMVHVIEAGETLYLAGLPPANIQQIMNDCLDRDLDGTAIARVIDVVLEGQRQGQSFDAIHAALWSAEK